MLGDQFPAVIVGGDNVAVRTIEERNIALVPIPVAIVPPGFGVERSLLVQDLGVVESSQSGCGENKQREPEKTPCGEGPVEESEGLVHGVCLTAKDVERLDDCQSRAWLPGARGYV